MAVQQELETMKTPVLTDRDAHRFSDAFDFVKRITAPDFDITSFGSDTIRVGCEV
jgi:hypothetical protein